MTPVPGGLFFHNARLVCPARGLDEIGDLWVADRRIASVGPGLACPPDARHIEAEGLVLSRGFLDARARFGEPGAEHKETIASGLEAAAFGGITEIVILPDSPSRLDSPAMVEFVARQGRRVRGPKLHCYGLATRDQAGHDLTEIGLMKASGIVGVTDGLVPVANAETFYRLLQYARTFDLPVLQMPQEPSLTRGGSMTAGPLCEALGLRGMSPQAEAMMLERDLRLVRMAGGGYHASLLSCIESIEVLRRAKAQGLAVTADTAPPYFLLNAEAVGDYRTFAKLMPPLRAEADRQAVEAALRDGTLDLIVSDHSPQDEDVKRLPFEEAAFGSIGVQTLLPLTLELWRRGVLALSDCLAKITVEPARMLRFPLPCLEVGAPADLVLFDPSKSWHLGAEPMPGRSFNSVFDGRKVTGKVCMTVVDGRVCYQEQNGEMEGSATPSGLLMEGL